MCENIINWLNCINVSSDTLRYFYSSVFQGYAAIFTLGGMFYIYYSQQIEMKQTLIKNILTNTIKRLTWTGVTKESKIAFNVNVIDYVENYFVKEYGINILTPPFNEISALVIAYKSIQSHNTAIKTDIKKIIVLSIFFLLSSLMILYSIDANRLLNSFAAYSGVIIIIVSFYYFFKLWSIINKIITIFHSKLI